MKKLLAAAFAVFSTLAFVTLFGDNIKALFGMSADSMSGNAHVTRRDSLQRKTLSNFGGSSQTVVGPVAVVNPVVNASRDSLSTFAIDVDTASYTWARRVLEGGNLPAPQSVRVEEWVNAFDYELPVPERQPFAVQVDGAVSPFDETKTLVRVALQGRKVSSEERKPTHLVFLVDVSGSMDSFDKLPLVKESLRFLTRQLNPRDTVALVTYAGDTRVVLPPTRVSNADIILRGVDSLVAGGGTNMGSGLELAYDLAVRDARPGHISRVIVLTDGDANLGRTSHAQMLDSIRDAVKAGVTMTTVGVGMGNYRADALEQLADKGNGQALYLDGRGAIARVFGEQLNGTLEAIAHDVKVQVAFDPEVVSSYRLVGYENRDIADEDFKNDHVDAGELGAGHQVTALYEVQLTSKPGALGKVSVRGQLPDSTEVFQLDTAMTRPSVSQALDEASSELRFATAVALGADRLRGNTSGGWSFEAIARLAEGATNGSNARREFVALMRRVPKPARVTMREFHEQYDNSGY
ncbi:MAG: vWA domain-containing protein [Archangium sp.]